MTHHLVTEAHPVRTHLHFDLDGALIESTLKAFGDLWIELAIDEVQKQAKFDRTHIRRVSDQSYATHGCGWSDLPANFGLKPEWVEYYYADVSPRVLEYVTALKPQPELSGLLKKASQYAHLRLLTQNHLNYAEPLLKYFGIDQYIPVLRGRAYKRTAEPFHRILTEEWGEAHHWLVEDSPANLPMAKRYGFTTVLVGGREGEADYHFATVEDFLHAFITDGLTAK